MVATETYKPDDADLSVQIGRINAAGAGAIVKMGQGGSTVTVAKNIKQLGARQAAPAGEHRQCDGVPRRGREPRRPLPLRGAAACNCPRRCTDPGMKAAVEAFLKAWQAKHGDADPYAAARAYDTMMVIANGVTAGEDDATARRCATRSRSCRPIQGAAATYSFSPEQHVGIIKNPFFIGVVQGGKLASRSRRRMIRRIRLGGSCASET